MANKNLLIVESPAKAKTINKYLGKDFIVEASVGHIKDLNKHTLSVDISNNFQPIYQILKDKKKVIEKLRQTAKNCNEVLIATDPDREGEAIAWHIAEEIQQANPKIKRVLFNEITPKGIKEGLANPRDLDENLYYSQQARRVLDRLIGYKISPFVSNALVTKSANALSAGRVQSVALRLICEREEDIEIFEPFVYWNIIGQFLAGKEVIEAKLVEFDGKQIKNPEGSKKPHRNETQDDYHKRIKKFFFIETEQQAKELVERIKKVQEFVVSKVTKKRIKKAPKPPFITSTLQQEAARKLGFSNKLTMQLAQRLYEGVPLGAEGNVGLITYMRTDSVRISNDAIESARLLIQQKYGQKYLPPNPVIYKSKNLNVQDAHEAIRPTDLNRTPESLKGLLDRNLLMLYELIYNRFLASQMTPAEFDQTVIEIKGEEFLFRATGRVIVFDGYLAVYAEEQTEEETEEEKKKLPKVSENQTLILNKLEIKDSQTQPPPRYNQASLIKELEEKGIGRPSTYATIVSTLLERKYVVLKNKSFIPTELGKEVNRTLLKYFSEIFNVEFTAKMEENLDTIAEGKTNYVEVVSKFYEPLTNLLSSANKEISSNGITCEVCGAPMVVRVSKFGRFLGCSNYPECKNTKPLYEVVQKEEPKLVEDVRCPVCGKPMVLRKSKRGEFYGCSDYPNCNGTRPLEEKKSPRFEPILIQEEKCPKCGSEMLLRLGPRGYFLACSTYPKCKGTKKITKDQAQKLIEKSAQKN
ncbi:type I DNA topoisomerase [Bacteroidetes/Chlorobi group bacterium Naka2016]|jgi:DNA topoisomerase-1|nr:MAG: type I DNA topoisomerase [Bacteroidetes/Chlorobi group bacterium Naka2016]